MPLYDYRCPKGHVFERRVPSEDRRTQTCDCGESADMVILKTAMIDPKLGVSRDFPSAAAKWTKRRWRLAAGLERDSSNYQSGYSKTDLDHEAYKTRKIMES